MMCYQVVRCDVLVGRDVMGKHVLRCDGLPGSDM